MTGQSTPRHRAAPANLFTIEEIEQRLVERLPYSVPKRSDTRFTWCFGLVLGSA